MSENVNEAGETEGTGEESLGREGGKVWGADGNRLGSAPYTGTCTGTPLGLARAHITPGVEGLGKNVESTSLTSPQLCLTLLVQKPPFESS